LILPATTPSPMGGTWDSYQQTAAQIARYSAHDAQAYLKDGILGVRCRLLSPYFRQAPLDWQLLTPLDLEQRVELTDGNICHLDIVPHQMFARRTLPGWLQYRTPVLSVWGGNLPRR
jgi:phytoene dehydrogenase-like protein